MPTTRRPIALLSLPIYGTLAMVVLIGLLVHEPLLKPVLYLWPHPFLLTIQRFVNPGSTIAWLAAPVAVAVLVSGIGALLQLKTGDGRPGLLPAAIIGLVTAAGVPAGLIAVGHLVAWVQGWPVGE